MVKPSTKWQCSARAAAAGRLSLGFRERKAKGGVSGSEGQGSKSKGKAGGLIYKVLTEHKAATQGARALGQCRVF